MILLSLVGPREVRFVLDDADGATPVSGLTAWGSGRATGVADRGRVSMALEAGSLELDVDPARELSVTVDTDEARVSVLGTRFTVSRSAVGTSVFVSRGRVEVACQGHDGVRVLSQGSRTTCLRNAGVGLGLALAHQRSGALDDGLRAVEEGLAHPDGEAATRAALVDLQVELLFALGRVEEALAAVDSTLAGPVALHHDTWTRAAAWGLERGDCEAARPALEALHAAGVAAATAHLARCLAPEDPEGARALLRSALDAGASGRARTRLEAELER